ncbi:helix-turn-helix domain-containing protein [Arthrobacter sp. RCC_34]|uniref:helix-turn-helix domain-containing protein n=1 Tax=Arthrobacter sp. RCC_34 TaxID=3239230 RepID=UPI003524F812
MTDILDSLASNVRRLRELHDLSLSQLSERSGVAKGTLFKVERAQTNASLETVQAIARSLGLQVTDLLTAAPEPAVEIVLDGEGEEITDETAVGRVLRRQLVGAGTVEIHAKTFHEGKVQFSVSHGTGAREHVFVRSGSIRLGPTGQEILAPAGSYVTYPADRAHRWQAEGGECLVWIVHTFPRTTPLHATHP